MTTASLNTGLLDRVKKAIATAKVAILTNPDYLFYGSILTKMNIAYDDKIKTAATDGITIVMSPAFVDSLPHRQRVFLLMHELMHVVYKHVDRVNGRDTKMWNVAADYVINNFLDHKKFDVIPGGLLDHQYDGMTADDVYFKLMQKKQDDPSYKPDPDHDDLLPPASMNGGKGNSAAANANHVGEFVKQAIGEAMTRVNMAQDGGRSAGNVPGDIKRYYEELLSPVIDWREALARFLHGTAKTDYSWAKPSRRGMSLGIYLPSLHGSSMDCIDFAIDTSGSVSEADFRKFMSEIHSVFETFNPENIGIMQFDHGIRDNRRVCSLDEFKDIEFVGGGGTNVGPILQEFTKSEGKALVVLTDGYFSHTAAQDPGKPVIWAIYNNNAFVPKFGEAIHFKMEDL